MAFIYPQNTFVPLQTLAICVLGVGSKKGVVNLSMLIKLFSVLLQPLNPSSCWGQREFSPWGTWGPVGGILCFNPGLSSGLINPVACPETLNAWGRYDVISAIFSMFRPELSPAGKGSLAMKRRNVKKRLGNLVTHSVIE